MNTNLNAFRYTIERTPYLRKFMPEVQAAIEQGGKAKAKMDAKMHVASMFMFSAGDLSIGGNMTGSGPADTAMRKIWEEKYQTYSITFGDTYVAIDRLDCFVRILGMADDFA